MSDESSRLAIVLLIAGLALIPAAIARSRGRSFLQWWWYGWALLPVAFVHALMLDDYTTVRDAPEPAKRMRVCSVCGQGNPEDAEVCHACGRPQHVLPKPPPAYRCAGCGASFEGDAASVCPSCGGSVKTPID